MNMNLYNHKHMGKISSDICVFISTKDTNGSACKLDSYFRQVRTSLCWLISLQLQEGLKLKIYVKPLSYDPIFVIPNSASPCPNYLGPATQILFHTSHDQMGDSYLSGQTGKTFTQCFTGLKTLNIQMLNLLSSPARIDKPAHSQIKHTRLQHSK